MPLTTQEKDELREYVLLRTCVEYRNAKPCVQRNDSEMIGDRHAGCVKAEAMLALIDKA